MKKLLFISLLGILVLLNSCTPARRLQTIPLKNRKYSGLKEGIIKKDLGDPLITSGTEEYTKGIKLDRNINDKIKNTMTGYIYNIHLTNNEILYYGGRDATKDYYFSERLIPLNTIKAKQGVSINRRTNLKSIVMAQNTYYFSKVLNFNYVVEEYQSRNCNNCFKKELIYNGKSGNTIKIIYREYIDDMARPAFTQNLNYDLSEGNLISFKGCKLEIINAKNTGVEFKILSSFNY